jgi:histidyl-tRNA synthetase
MLIEPKILKGFRDFLPAEASVRKDIVHRLEALFEKFGFQPIDTPVLEYTEVLLGKGGGETDKQVYRFEDQGGRDVSMRFDLTVPFARFMAKNETKLTIPFKRYHIDKVWRGENTQRGRYREFTQCDFDIVGTNSVSSDFEILLMMYRAFESLGIEDVTIRVNHRGIFNRFLKTLEIEDRSVEIMRRIDKIAKIGPEAVRDQLLELLSGEDADKVLRYVQPLDTFEDSLNMLIDLTGEDQEDTRRMKQLFEGFRELGIQNRFFFDTSIMRGLDYYTGIVYETFFNELPEIGSVCSGGRYDNLASLYTKTELPGVGSSIGLDRLLAALEELGRVSEDAASADIAVFCLDEGLMGYYHGLAEAFRGRGFRCEVFFEKKKISQQFRLAEKKLIPLALICGEEEQRRGTVSLRNMKDRTTLEGLNMEEAFEKAKHLLSHAQSENPSAPGKKEE